MSGFRRVCLGVFAAFCALAAGAAPPRNGAGPYQRADIVASRYGLFPVPNSGGVLFAQGRSFLRLTPNKPVCVIDGVKVYLNFPARVQADRPQLCRLDEQKTIGPLSPRRTGVFRHRVTTITIDPGHGGRDRGAVLVLGGIAFRNAQDQHDEDAEHRDQLKQLEPAALAAVVQTPGRDAETGQQDRQAEKRGEDRLFQRV